MSLSKKDLDELKPILDKTVQKFLGFSEPTVVTISLNCLDKGYDQKKTISKLASILDDGAATSFADTLYSTLDEYKSKSTSTRRPRKRKDESMFDESEVPRKTNRFDVVADETPVVLPPPLLLPPAALLPPPGVQIPQPDAEASPGQLSADRIKEMMANAQKMIQERKEQLNIKPTPPPPSADVNRAQQLMDDAKEKARRALEMQQRTSELQARIHAQLANAGIRGEITLPATATAGKQQGFKPTPLILDDKGRTIDAKTGQTIELQHHMPTLKANIRAKRREQFKAVQERPPEEISESKFFDPRVSLNVPQRSRKLFKFHEKGKFEQLGQKVRAKNQLERLQSAIAQAAKKTGIVTAAKLATLQPYKSVGDDVVPEAEWWDTFIIKGNSCENVKNEDIEGITNLIEHPIQMKPPAEPEKPKQISVMLTKKKKVPTATLR